jgi:hypothetical protein
MGKQGFISTLFDLAWEERARSVGVRAEEIEVRVRFMFRKDLDFQSSYPFNQKPVHSGLPTVPGH